MYENPGGARPATSRCRRLWIVPVM